MPDVAHVEEARLTVAATLTRDEVAADPWDVLVIGAGPAGATAAREVARHGGRVLLVDKVAFPRGKVCGGCLNGNALAGLSAAGLGDLPSIMGAVPLADVRTSAGGREVTLPLPRGVSVSREVFDAGLVRAAVATGVAFLPNTKAVMGDVTDHARVVRLGGVPATARVVIAAAGLSGRFCATEVGDPVVHPGSRIGVGIVIDQAPVFYRPGTIYMATGPAGYVGLVRLEDGRLDAAAALDGDAVRAAGGPGRTAAAILADTGWPAILGLAAARWKGTPPLTSRPRRVAGRRWFAVGDAAGYVEPFTGEGMAWAITGGRAVAPFAVAGAHAWDDRLMTGWTREHARVVGRRQWVCRAVAAGLRSPTLTRAAVRLLAVLPEVATPFVQMLYRPSPGTGLESPA